MSETAVTLYGLSQDIVAHVDTIESLDPATDQEAIVELQAQLTDMLTKHADKVDAFAAYVRRCEQESEFCKVQAQRVRAAATAWEVRADRLREYARRTIESLPRVGKSENYARLEGHEATISLRAGRASVDVYDETAVPDEFATVTITMPAITWADIAPMIQTDPPPTVHRTVDKLLLKQALGQMMDVAGARMKFGEPSVCIK